MLVVLARDGDEAAVSLAGICDPGEVRVLRPEDLAVAGWCEYVGEVPIAEPAAVIGGQAISRDAVGGVLTRLLRITERDVLHVARQDRSYVATEMTAFLIGWLTNLTCPVINRPTPQCLAGPSWSQEQWVVTASQVGLAVRPVRRQVVFNSSADAPFETAATEMVVVGDRCFGNADRGLAAGALRLARAAGVDVLSLQFGGSGELVSANPSPDLTSADVMQAVRDRLLA